MLERLGLAPNATVADIKRQYRTLARAFHPDHNGGDHRASARFRAIRAAYEELLAVLGASGPDENDDANDDENDDAMMDLVARKGPVPESRAASSPATRIDTNAVARLITETRAKLARCRTELDRREADVRDGETRARAARARGDESLARHFERRVEADRSRAAALTGEIARLERELEGLTFRG